MPNKQNHRGANPKDIKLFSQKALPKLKDATIDLSYLIYRGYNPQSAVKLVGNRYLFTERQRKVISHSACGKDQVIERSAKQLQKDQLKGKKLVIDGYNQLITLEASLSKAPIFIGLDGCYRDIASVHSTYRKVEETLPALQLFADTLSKMEVEQVLWVFDRPVSNSGHLKKYILELAETHNWDWEVILDYNPDNYIIAKDDWVAISSDSYVLENCKAWFNLNAYIIENHVTDPWLIDFR